MNEENYIFAFFTKLTLSVDMQVIGNLTAALDKGYLAL